MGSTNNSQPSLTLDELKKLVKSGEIDTIVVVMTDMQGRLVGKRIHALSLSMKLPIMELKVATIC